MEQKNDTAQMELLNRKLEEALEAKRGPSKPPIQTGLLFYQAGGTAAAEHLLKLLLDRMSLRLSQVSAVYEEDALLSETNRLLQSCDMLFVISGVSGGRPAAASPLLQALHAEFSGESEPKGVYALHGKRFTGYLPEGVKKMICILPDDREEFSVMLDQAAVKISGKFSLPLREKQEEDFNETAQKESLSLLLSEREQEKQMNLKADF